MSAYAGVSTLKDLHALQLRALGSMNTPPIETFPRYATPQSSEKRKSRSKIKVDDRSFKAKVNESIDIKAAESHSPNIALDPNALSKALLKEYEGVKSNYNITPGASPSRKRQRVYGDRLVISCSIHN